MNPTKFVLHFSDFYVVFYAIYKFQPKLKYYLRITLQLGPRSFWVHNYTLTFAL
jgi:hypothetical protein